jgi:hypothetical protein
MKKELFTGIASISGSFWYDGFTEWFSKQEHVYSDVFYFSLGEKEKDGKNPRLASVEDCTLQIVGGLKCLGHEVFFEYNEGNHFGPLIERIEKAITHILA